MTIFYFLLTVGVTITFLFVLRKAKESNDSIDTSIETKVQSSSNLTLSKDKFSIKIPDFIWEIQYLEKNIISYSYYYNSLDERILYTVKNSFDYLENNSSIITNYNGSKYSYYYKKSLRLLELSEILNKQFDSEKNKTFAQAIRETFSYCILEAYIIHLCNLFANKPIIKLINCNFTESFSFFSNLIVICGNKVLMTFEQPPNKDDLVNFNLCLSNSFNKKIEIKVIILEVFYNNCMRSIIDSKHYVEDLPRTIYNLFSTVILNGSNDIGDEIANAILLMSEEKELDLNTELGLSVDDIMFF